MAKKVKAGSIYRPKYTDKHGKRVESQVYWCKFYVNGAPVRLSTKTTDWNEAEVFLRQKLGQHASGLQINVTAERARMGDLFALLLEEYKTLERKTIYDLKCKLKSRLTPAFGSIPARSFSTIDVKRYIQLRQRQKAAPGTINRELAVVRRALYLALEQEPPLIARMPKFHLLPLDNVREGILDRDHYVALRQALPEYLAALFVMAYHVGCRKGELLAVQWSHVDFKQARILMPGRNTKNRHSKYLPIYGEMRGYLEMAETNKHPECPFVFQKDGLPISSFRKTWATACAAAGVPDLLFHDLRRTALTNMEHAGISRSVAMSISGHLTENAYRRYLIASPKAIDRAAQVMNDYLFNKSDDGAGKDSGQSQDRSKRTH